MAWTWVCSLMFILEICWVEKWIGWVQVECSALPVFWCCNEIPGVCVCVLVGGVVYKKKRQLCTIVLEDRRSGLNSSGFLVEDCLTVTGAYLKGHPTWRDREAEYGEAPHCLQENPLMISTVGDGVQYSLANPHSFGSHHLFTSLYWRPAIQHMAQAVS